jgi:hypothetical protein
MAAVIAGLGAFVYVRTGADLLDTVDAGLCSRAELLVADLQHHDLARVNVVPTLIESDEVFAQITDASGRTIQSSSPISRWRLLPLPVVQSLHTPELYARKIPGIDDMVRVLAVPVNTPRGRFVVLAGASLQDRRDELLALGWTLAVAGSAALVLRNPWSGNAVSWTGPATNSAPRSRFSAWSWTWRSPARQPWTS